MRFFSISEILREKHSDEKVTLLLRHAERRHILPTDKNYGAKVPLTEVGKNQALGAGKEIFQYSFGASFFFGASPVLRCRQTAALIAEGCGAINFNAVEKIKVFDRLAKFYVNENVDYEKHLKEGFYPAICRFIQDEKLSGFLPLETGSKEFLKLLLENSFADFNVFISHDAWIVPFLAFYTHLQFSPQNWMNFLSGAAILFSADRKSLRIYPVKFLGDGYLHFGEEIPR